MNEPAVFIDPVHTHAARRAPRQRGPAHRPPRDPQRLRPADDALHLRGAAASCSRTSGPSCSPRATFAGGQRYAAVWPGDNTSDWDAPARDHPDARWAWASRASPFVGSDIGGFAEAPTPELFTRWLQVGRLLPVHAHAHRVRHARPGALVVRHRATRRSTGAPSSCATELLPHIYNVMHEASQTGVPAMRPLLLEYPDDARHLRTRRPVPVRARPAGGAGRCARARPSARSTCQPATGTTSGPASRHAGRPRAIRVPVTLESIPVFVRAGAFVFRQPVVQHTGEMAGQPLEVVVYPAAESSASSTRTTARAAPT